MVDKLVNDNGKYFQSTSNHAALFVHLNVVMLIKCQAYQIFILSCLSIFYILL